MGNYTCQNSLDAFEKWFEMAVLFLIESPGKRATKKVCNEFHRGPPSETLLKEKHMNRTDWIGTIGVTLLLVAFLLNLLGKLKRHSPGYLLLNAFGAGAACFASILLKYLPFVILEGCWTLVSVIGLMTYVKALKR
jgi:hypothetical protein